MNEPRPIGLSKKLILLLASTACFMVILDTTIVNVAITSISQSFQSSLAGLQWVVDGYALTFASLLLSSGALADRVGPRQAFGIGLSLFSLASLACGLAGSLAILVLARGLQGAGAAILIPASLALLSRTFTERTERNRALSIWGGVGGGLAMACGPLMGGILTGALGWRSVFLINLPVGLAGLYLTSRLARESAAPSDRHLDLPGQGLAIVSLAAVTFLFIEGPALGWSSVAAEIAGIVALFCAGAFIYVESRSHEPMLPLELFQIREFTLASAAGLGLNFAFYGQFFFLNIYLQQGLGLTPAQAGLRFFPETIGGILFATTAGRLSHRIPPRNFVILGTAISALGMLGLATFGFKGSPWIDGLMLIATGIGIGTPASLIAVMLGAVPPERAGIASGALNAARQTGGLLGVAVLGALVGHSNVAGVPLALSIAAGVMGLGTVMALGMKASQSCSESLAEAAAEAMA